MKSFLREILSTLIFAVVIFFLLQTTIQSSVVVGSSMEPTFQEGQRLLVNKAAYDFTISSWRIFHFAEPRRGDVVIFHPPTGGEKDYIKRIIGLPGDTVEIKNGKVYINGIALEETYIKNFPTYSISPTRINDNYFFVLGDNRNNSNDSHTGWLLPRQNLIGKAWLSIWPPADWGPAANYPLDEQFTMQR